MTGLKPMPRMQAGEPQEKPGYRSAALQADRGTEARLRIDRLRDL